MPLQLHPHAIKKIKSFSVAELEKTLVRNGNFVDWPTIWGLSKVDQLLPRTKELEVYEQTFVGRNPLFTFIGDTIAEELQAGVEHQPQGEAVPLTTLPGYERLDDVVDRILDQFCAELPRSYVLTLPLPSELPNLLDGDDEIRFGNSIRLIRIDATFDERYSIKGSYTSSLSRMLMGESGWEEGGQALQVEIAGFVSGWSETPPLTSALSLVRSLLGLLSTGGFDPRANLASKGSIEIAYVHEGLSNDRWRLCKSARLGHTMSVALESFGPLHFLRSAPQGTLALGLKHVLPAFDVGPYAARLRLAARWLFDGYHSEPLLAFVQTTVCLEILLGENSKGESIGGALKSRAAYLLGSTHHDRITIERIVEDAYETRGKIVHTGKDSLTVREEDRLSELQTICRRVINKELELLRGDRAK